MSNNFYPLNLPGLAWPVKREAIWAKAGTVLTASQREYRWGFETIPRWQWTLKYDFLREIPALAQADMQAIVGLFNSSYGQLGTFLWTDPDESTVAAQQFGVGDGVTTAFVLARTWASFIEPVNYAVPTQVTDNGTPTAAYTLSNNNTVVFTVAPTAGHVLRWTGSYAYRCRFLDPTMEFEKFCSLYWSQSGLKIISLKD